MLSLLPLLNWGCITPAKLIEMHNTRLLPVPEKVTLEPAPPLREHAVPLELDKTSPAPQTVTLTRDGALLTALMNNRALRAARLGPQIGSTYVPEAQAVFDPALMATFSTGHDTRRLGTVTEDPTSSSAIAGTLGGTLSTQLLNQLRKVSRIAYYQQYPVVEVDDTRGSATLQEYLPTGTSIFLTGAVSATQTNSIEDHQGSWTLGVNQALLRGAGTTVNLVAVNQAKNQARQSQFAFKGTVLDIVRQTELAYWNLVLAREILTIRQFAVTLAEEQRRRNEEFLKVGKAIEGDLMAAQAEKATRMADLSDAQAAIQAQTYALIHLLNPDAKQKWSLNFEPGDPAEAVHIDINPEACENLAEQYRPELAQARLDLENLGLNVIKANNDLLPNLDLVASYGRTSRGRLSGDTSRFLDDSNFENYQIGIEFSTPILRRAEHARHRRAMLLDRQGNQTFSSLQLAVAAEVRQAAVEVNKQWQRIGAAQEALKSRTEQLRVAQGRNEAGKTTNLDLLLVQRDFIQAEIDEVSARVKYIQALTSLYAAEGTLLERRGIFLDVETLP